MTEFETFLRGLGLLKNAVVSQLTWSPEAEALRFEIDDLYGHFKGQAQYPGAVSGVIELREVRRVSFDIDTTEEKLIIFDFDTEPLDPGRHLATVTFWPDGIVRAWYGLATFPQIDSPGSRS